jgi:type I restriction enzyme S subunit
MAGEWPRVRLAEVVDFLAGFAFKSAFYTEAPIGPRLCLGANVAPGTPDWSKLRYWPQSMCEGVERYSLVDGDVVLAMDRPWIPGGLKVFRFTKADGPALLVQRVARLRGSSQLDPGYLHAVLRHPAFTDYILGVQTGTTVPHISAGQILGFEIDLPPLDEQRRIAAVLGALDDKIELNRKMNRTLEEMAQALFKSWFIDFDGHDDLVDSEIGPVPRGWEVRSLDAIADFLNGAACQKYPASPGEPWLPVIKIRELNQGVTDQTDRATARIPDKWHVRDGDVLFSWSGSLVVKVWTGGAGALNQHLFKVTSGVYPRWFYLSWIQHHLCEFQRIAADKATTMGHIKRHHLTDAKCAVPPVDVLAKVGALLEPVVNRQVANELESRILAELRDTLLPKLISGELRVPEAEDAVGPAAGPRSPSAAGEAPLP